MYSGALAKGTWKNKRLQVSIFLNFCQAHEVDPESPMLYDVMALVIHLMNRLQAPGSVANYFSLVKMWFTAVTGGTDILIRTMLSYLRRECLECCNMRSKEHTRCHLPSCQR